MHKRMVMASISAALALGALDIASAAHATSPVTGTREKITFEGLVGIRKTKPIYHHYDGLEWTAISAVGGKAEPGAQGFISVVRGQDAACLEGSSSGGSGGFSLKRGLFRLESGRFAAFADARVRVTFSAYRKGVLVGTLEESVPPRSTLIQFGETFAYIDAIMIYASGPGQALCMDNLVVRF